MDRCAAHVVMVGALFALIATPLSAADVHQFWDQRCGACHGHAATFARANLTVADGKLQGRHHKDDLKRFMAQHEMGPSLVDEIHDMLLAQVQAAPTYQQKCARCHHAAAEFARASLDLRDGKLTGRQTGRPVATFLGSHGGLMADEVTPMVETLTRIHREVH